MAPKRERLPRWVEQDPYNGAVFAYYRFVRDLTVVFPERPGRDPLMAAWSETEFVAMDHADDYGWPPEMGIPAASRRVAQRVEYLVRWREVLPVKTVPYRYEIWAFNAPAAKLLAALERLPDDVHAAVTLVGPEASAARVRETVRRIPRRLPEDAPLFARAAVMIRDAFGL